MTQRKVKLFYVYIITESKWKLFMRPTWHDGPYLTLYLKLHCRLHRPASLWDLWEASKGVWLVYEPLRMLPSRLFAFPLYLWLYFMALPEPDPWSVPLREGSIQSTHTHRLKCDLLQATHWEEYGDAHTAFHTEVPQFMGKLWICEAP